MEITNNKTKTIDKVFTTFVCLIPILEYYRSPIPMFNYATLIAMVFGVLFTVLFFTKRQHKSTAPKYAVAYIVFISLNVIVTSLQYNYSFSWANLSSWVRMVVLLYSLVLVGSGHFDVAFAKKALSFIICISSVIIFAQFLLGNLAGVRTKLVIESLLSESGYSQAGMRYSALYMEPAHFAQSATIFLILTVFSDSKRKSDYVAIVITSFGILFSGSGQGYLYLLLIAFLFTFRYLFLGKGNFGNRVALVLFTAAIVLLMSLLFLNIPYIQFSLSRIISVDGAIGGQALSGRIGSGVRFNDLLDEQKIFGLGFGHSKDITTLYLTSFNTHLIECGYVSIVFLLFFVLMGLRNKRFISFVFSVYFVLLIVFASGANPMTLAYMLLFIHHSGMKQTKKLCKCLLVPEERSFYARIKGF